MGDVTDWIVFLCVCVCARGCPAAAHMQKGKSVLKMSSQCLFLVLCSLQSPGLHLTLESMAAIPEVI